MRTMSSLLEGVIEGLRYKFDTDKFAANLSEKMRRSKLPVYQPKDTRTALSQLQASTGRVPKAESDHLQPSAKRFHANPKLAKPEKDLPQTFNFSQKTSSAVSFEATSKQGNVALNKRKKMPSLSRMTRADMEKFMALKVVEAELRDQNQLLEVAQQQLKQELKLAKDQVHDYMIKNQNLQTENEALSKRVQNCAVILENNLIDPVSANKIIEDNEQRSACRRDTMALVENLQWELENWGRNIVEKRDGFQEIRLKLQNAKEESNKIVEEMDFFKQEMEEWRLCLSQVKQHLDQNVE